MNTHYLSLAVLVSLMTMPAHAVISTMDLFQVNRMVALQTAAQELNISEEEVYSLTTISIKDITKVDITTNDMGIQLYGNLADGSMFDCWYDFEQRAVTVAIRWINNQQGDYCKIPMYEKVTGAVLYNYMRKQVQESSGKYAQALVDAAPMEQCDNYPLVTQTLILALCAAN